MLNKADQKDITAALTSASAQSGIAINLVVKNASEGYLPYLLLDASIIAMLADAALFHSGLLANRYWLFVVALILFVLAFTPWAQSVLIRFLPERIRHHHAAKSAVLAFHAASHHAEAQQPVILLYVSLAERYVHILHSRSLNDTIPHSFWENTIKNFGKAVKVGGLKGACLKAIHVMAIGTD